MRRVVVIVACLLAGSAAWVWSDIRTAKLGLRFTSDERMNGNLARIEEVLGSLVPAYSGADSLGFAIPAHACVASTTDCWTIASNTLALTAASATATSTSGNGRSVTLTAGTAYGNGDDGGDLTLTAGNTTGGTAGAAGDVTLTPGTYASAPTMATDGAIVLDGRVVLDPTATTVTGSAALNPLASTIPLNCTNGAGCTVTLDVTGARDGQLLVIVGASSTNTITVNDSGNANLGGSRALGAGDTLLVVYSDSASRWLELAYANN